jgi:PAS domain S-box-containing protein
MGINAILRLKKRYILILSVLLSEVLTSLMSLLLTGRITHEFLITGGVVSLIVASILIVIITQSHKLILERDVLQTEVEKHLRGLEETNASLLQEIEERKLAENRIVALIDALPDIIYFKNTESRNLVVNLAFAKLTGLEKEETQGKTDMELLPPELAEHCKNQDAEVIRGGKLMRYVEEHAFHGERVFQETIKVPLYAKSGDCTGLVGITRDITELKKAEEEAKKSLKEKEVLLKEIHHRVKNNMAIISALLQLQARYCSDEKLNMMFRDSRSRISSMALVHEKLYQTKDFANINFREYVEELVGHIMSSYGMKEGDIGLLLSIDDINLNIDTIIPCGLILNELTTNSLKHAFEDVEQPKISIAFNIEGDQAALVYSDNGRGIPEHVDFQDSETLGLQIVKMLAFQLKGSFELERDDETRFTINFKLEK